MKKPPSPHYRHRFPAELISHAVWLYHVFSLSFRDVELLLAERGIIVSYESFRRWCGKFGSSFAANLRRRRPPPTNDTVDGRRRAALDDANQGLAVVVVEQRCFPRSLPVDQPIRPCVLNFSTQSRTICSVTPPITAASDLVAPS
ncbi:IS6 family transposase [Acidisoma silvae]|uniref:IS6 family transposase n=1 Tax=Acidisoma silvae TaxID=2802396 RepID=A0A963YUQ8_9PROT|nr:IS6 family transposase [Acidisoma silvae]